jgi:drug/metabolite transporter (DMT)-like permease
MARMLALASLWTAPFGLASIPASRFAWGSLGAVLALGAIGTGVAFVCMGMLVGRVGSTRASFATYMVPVVALILGLVVRDERVAAVAIGGIGLVIVGALLASRRES